MVEERRTSEECGAALKAALLETVYANERLHQLQLARFTSLQASLQASQQASQQASAAAIAPEQAQATPIAASNDSYADGSSSSSGGDGGAGAGSDGIGGIAGDGSGIDVSAPTSQDIPSSSSSSSSVMLESEESLEYDEAAV